ncbi:ABC-2 type transport system ATP-binding protein [Gordonia malaquae]|uniref:Putative ABC transporter ATP-binding protein n=1 Tax=Gordonia malaquae NBRC 108250 TaxID=1223542 RepID=M3TDE4_GORML|nr:putative ABC transporter ATP-binding protein [Gordonia malaquae NBRC 108250]SED25544.1 ABC-2 type transport system ATP-binding protein [Gordonia malaquae]
MGRVWPRLAGVPEPSVSSVALSISGLVKRFDDVVAVDGLDLELRTGEVLALLGPNGAGKTTTVEICEGFGAPDAGRVEVLGLDPIADNDALRSRIGVMLQGGGAYPGAKAAEMLRLCASYSSDPIDPDWLMDVLGIADVATTPFRRLSGGQQQRLSLACALVGRPELVFLDEPTAGLDAHARIMVWELISRLKSDGVSVLLTTHHLDEAEELADHIVIVDRGRVVASGTPADLVRRDAEGQLRVTAEGLEAAELEKALPDGFSCRRSPAGDVLVAGDITPGIVAAVTAWCAEHDILVTSLAVDTNSLQDVFLELTGREVRA